MKKDFDPKFIERYKPLFEENEFNEFLRFCKLPLKKAIRVNTSRISSEDFEKRALKNGWILEKIPYVDNGFFIDREDRSKPLWKSIEYFAGLFYIQETSSMIPPMFLSPKPWDIVLDVSAAPWSKTTQIANMMNSKWLVVWNDIVQNRLRALEININYQGIINTSISKLDWRDFWRYFSEVFDKILLDAPCSWEWTMRKDDINWSLTTIEELSRLQKRLIISAFQALKVGGEMVYSTCTMAPEEDEEIIDFAKKEFGEKIEVLECNLPWLKSVPWICEWQWKILDKDCVKWHKIWPHINDTEGFFIVKFRKLSSIDTEKKQYFTKKKEEKVLKSKELKILIWKLEKRFLFEKDLFDNYLIIKTWKEYFIRSKESNYFSDFPNIISSGIPFWEEVNNDFLLSFYFAQTFWKFAKKNFVELESVEKAEKYRIGESFVLEKKELNNSEDWQVIVFWDWLCLWTSLLQKWTKLKNQVPRTNIKI